MEELNFTVEGVANLTLELFERSLIVLVLNDYIGKNFSSEELDTFFENVKSQGFKQIAEACKQSGELSTEKTEIISQGLDKALSFARNKYGIASDVEEDKFKAMQN
jgi:uncharacterized protein YeeX (DUF496 family)